MYDAEYSFEHDPADAGDHFIIHISSSFTFSISYSIVADARIFLHSS